MSDTIEVFISYSKQDKELRDQLLAHLRPLETKGIISWHDRQILPGTEWDEEIKARLNAADVILLLISADFLATDYCTQVEIPEALRRHHAGDATVMPVILRHCGWKHTPLAAIQAYPEKAKPIKSWSDIDEACTNVVEGVYLAATEIQKQRSQQRQVEEQKKVPQAEQYQTEELVQIKETLKEPPTPYPVKPSLDTFEFQVATLRKKTDTQSGFLGFGTREVVTYSVERTQKLSEYFTEKLGDNVFLDMVAIPAGSFQMGSTESSREQPVHRVTIAPFFLGKYPVTQTQWKAVAALPKINRDLTPDPAKFKGTDRPVERVSWWEAVEFCERLSHQTKRTYRLPSEAEWEYACRAETTTPFHFGETITPDLVNYDGNYTYGAAPKGVYREQTTTVGNFAVANAFGLYDMHGNVWEWCADHWHENYQGAPDDGSVWLTADQEAKRAVRGGSWYNDPGDCRSAFRTFGAPVIRDLTLGFRVVWGLA